MDHTNAILERLLALHPKVIDLSLERMERLLAALDHPERRLPPTIHIAGTNGKGSTTAFLRAALEAAGNGVHVYTSPHLVRFNERIRLAEPGGGRLVDDATLAEALERAERANGGEPITFFEITTAAAMLLFSERPAEALVLETGLGGRLDATNVIDSPLVSVITQIGLDHQRFLGDGIEAIAGEKAGIIKPGRPVVAAPQSDQVTAVLEKASARARAPLHLGGQDWSVLEEHGRLVYQDENALFDLPAPRLPGRHQFVNAGTAIAAIRAAGLWTGVEAAETALTTVDWPARLQRLTKGRVVETAMPGAEIWLDGGHNPDAGEALAAYMADLEDRVSRPLFLITGMLSTKDPVGFFRPFSGLVRHAFTVPVFGSDAAIEPAPLADMAEAAGVPAEPVSSVRTALRLLAESWRFEPPPRILICGSLYLAGDVLSQNGTPPT
ncbi:bifunctional folylpolyglutamate synthase/dihydrofolate synthase [Amorphus orientalis]|uniref:tetrahydrofolate synthase n=1 Tax=Amorphus orientalis TaxID=649198 RepID=A0AAE4ARG5_9HYPH|nr:folylpolyglutamate synthase/dihydrofolate synthase family protein [Amorphus orientalis]MDQ0314187.1 dihydrofolate synthase/folylpolyglutamate synthase [Amorphus orientalis]